MKQYGLNELRQMFLDFFKSKNHMVVKSYSLVPENDNSLLLINAGMAPLKPYFTGNSDDYNEDGVILIKKGKKVFHQVKGE